MVVEVVLPVLSGEFVGQELQRVGVTVAGGGEDGPGGGEQVRVPQAEGREFVDGVVVRGVGRCGVAPRRAQSWTPAISRTTAVTAALM